MAFRSQKSIIVFLCFLALPSAMLAQPICAQVLGRQSSLSALFNQEMKTLDIPVSNVQDMREEVVLTEDRTRPGKGYKILSGVDRYTNVGQLDDFRRYVYSLRALEKNLAQVSPRVEQVKRVFYPLFGTDVALAVLAFPKAKEILAIDGNPLFSDADLNSLKLLAKSGLGGAWRGAQHIEDEKYTGPRILGAILDLTPQAEILSIEVFSAPSELGARASGVITFDLHDGVGRRSLTYIAADIPSRGYLAPSSNPQAIFQIIANFAPQSAIVKAAMTSFANRENPENAKFLVQLLAQNKGVLLEGLASEVIAAQQLFNYSPEVSPSFPNTVAKPQLYNNGQSQVIENVPFGYRKGLLMTDFSQQEAGSTH